MAKRPCASRCHLIWSLEVGLSPGDFLFDGDPAIPSPPEKRHILFLACGQTAGWMKTPLGTVADLGPGYIVLDGSQLSAIGAQQAPPLFGPCLLWPRLPISATAELFLTCHGVNDDIQPHILNSSCQGAGTDSRFGKGLGWSCRRLPYRASSRGKSRKRIWGTNFLRSW